MKLCVHIHLFYLEQWDEIKCLLHNLQDWDYDLFVTLQTPRHALELDIKNFHADSRVFYVDNCGYDIGPFVYLLHQIQLEDYDLVLKLHTKTKAGEMVVRGMKFTKSEWRKQLLYSLAGSKETIRRHIDCFRKNAHLGMVGSQKYVWNVKDWSSSYLWNKINHESVKMLGTKCKGDELFVAGTMFWVRSKLLVPIKQRFSLEDFTKTEPGIDDGTLAHIVERLLGVCVLKQGYTISGAIAPQSPSPFIMEKQPPLFDNTPSSKSRLKRQKGELHLIILWANARPKQQEILDDLKKCPALTLLECYDVQWTPEEVANNFTRFYGVKLESGSFKEEECGTGRFLLIILWDTAPKYEITQTSHGMEAVNIRLFSLKQKYRQWTGGGHKIHSTNSPRKTEHDLTLLLGVNSDDYLAQAPSAWDGAFRPLKRDLSGSNGWASFQEFFYTLNATARYIVLRGEEYFDESRHDDTPGDIDIFTDDYDNLAYIVNGKAKINPHRPHYLTKIGEGEYYVDIWDKRNEYYDEEWSRQMLETRQFAPDGYYLPERNLRFFEFIYHCLIHKAKLTEKYHATGRELFRQSDLAPVAQQKEGAPPSFDLYFHLLRTFMAERNYRFVRPKDPTVFYHESRAEDVPWFLEKRGCCQLLSPRIVKGNGGFSFYTAFRDGVKIFIKCENKKCWGGGARNEYDVSLKLSEADPEHFLRPLFYEESDSHCCVAFEFIDAPALSSILWELSPERKRDIVRQMEEIGRTLFEQKTAHRDIRPDNLIITEQGRLLLIDTQWAVSIDPYKELPKVAEHPAWVSELGEEYKMAQHCWDDMWSLWQISLLLGCESSYCRDRVGRSTIQFNIGEVLQQSLQALAQKTSESPKRDAEAAPDSASDTNSSGKYPHWLIRLLACFIVKRRNRRHFRKKYSAPR